MNQPWKILGKPEDIDVVSPEGQVRCSVKGYFSPNSIIVDDLKADIEIGDEIRRILPNGKEEVFIVQDPAYHGDTPFGSFYDVSVSKRGAFPKRTGGHYNINVNGVNARVNINSNDLSSNIVSNETVFTELKACLSKVSAEDRAVLYKAIDEMERAEDQNGFLKGYNAFISSAANHMTLIAPMIPALADILKRL